MHKPFPPLNALRAFEAAARHVSFAKAALELGVTAGALSHQIRGLEELLGLKLFERRVRSIALTEAGKQLYPGLQIGFMHIKDAVFGLSTPRTAHNLAISTPPGFTSKWLAQRLHRFSSAYPEIDTRVFSTLELANFTTDGIDIAIRSRLTDAPPEPRLAMEKLIELSFVPVCSPSFASAHGPFATPQSLQGLPLIHDEAFTERNGMPKWHDWFRHAGLKGVDINRGLRFSSADHALEAAVEGAGILLAPNVLAYDELRAGRLVIAVRLFLRSDRAYWLVYPRLRQDQPKLKAFRTWIMREVAAVDWKSFENPST